LNRMIRRPLAGAVMAMSFSLLALLPVSAGAITLPPGFVMENEVPDAVWDIPVAIVYLPDGSFLAAEKRGVVSIVQHGIRNSTPVWSAEDEVLNVDDRGLLGIAVDPDFETNRFVYFLYTVDPDTDGVDDNAHGFGRLTRYTLTIGDPPVVDPASRTILMGVDWPHGPLSASPSHSIGDLHWGADGSLFVSMGDGAEFNSMDQGGQEPAAFGAGKTDPSEDIGAFRSQYIRSLCGSVLRINPATGHGYASNPYVDGDLTSVASRIWVYGLRNPFRFNVRPGTGVADTSAGNPGTLYIGDVGWNQTEEMSVAPTGGYNFGWPCREGPHDQVEYQNGTPAHSDCSTVGVTSDNPSPATDPLLCWDHVSASASCPPGYKGNTSTGGVFYQGALYPTSYVGSHFFADFGANWIKVVKTDAANQFVSLEDFGDGMAGPVQLTTDPSNGDLIYVSIVQQQIRRIRYTGTVNGNTPPVAQGSATPDAGTPPIAVQFTGDTSFDPDGQAITYEWTFGDGAGALTANPQHTYTAPGLYRAVLTVRDPAGAIDRTTVIVAAFESTAFPTTPVVDDFDRADGPIGGAWVGETSGLAIANNQLALTSAGAGVTWDGQVFGANQEAYITIDPLQAGAPEHDLDLKIQGTGLNPPRIEVRYDDTVPWVAVGTYDPINGWQGNAVFPVQLQSGDQLGARAYENGAVQVYVNGQLIGATDVSFWLYYASGGRIGLTLVGAPASRLDDFGGGDAVFDSNMPPVATILEPVDSTFFAAGDTVILHGTAVDAEDPASAMTYRFDVDLHHNNHVHLSTHVVADTVGSFVAENHDDGTGVWFEIRFAATDGGGKSDTARVSIFPEIDLKPGGFWFNLPQLGTADTSICMFRIHNQGRMPAPMFHWTLSADGTQLLAEGDTLIAPLDSVTIARELLPSLTEGLHVLRITADTLGAVVETSEVNNGFSGTILVVPGNGTLDVPGPFPAKLALGPAYPNPTASGVALTLGLPRDADVEFSVHDILGREIWHAAAAHRAAGEVRLEWNGRTGRGAPVRPGIYMARVQAGADVLTRRFVVLR